MLNRLKNYYWLLQKKQRLKARLSVPENRYFQSYIQDQECQVFTQLQHNDQNNDIDTRLKSAVNWLLYAQQQTDDDGVPLGYFPLSDDNGWRASYPETTGYIITTLLKYASNYLNSDVRTAALKMADWELEIQMPSGAVQGGPVCSPDKQTPAAFNTGMVADGLVSAYQESGEDKYLDAALHACKFLANDLDSQGFFTTNGDFVRPGEIKSYTCLCAWAMYRAGLLANDDHIKNAAVFSIEAVLRQRNAHGWFKNNCLTNSSEPLTHTIGYILQGIFEVGVLSGRHDFIDAVRQSLSGLIKAIQSNGYLSARLSDDWQPKANYVCLTGSVQIAIVAFRFYQEYEDNIFVDSGHKLTNFVKATQLLSADNPAMIGAIAGSYPILGEYMIGGYPNWATKYYIDALMLQQQII